MEDRDISIDQLKTVYKTQTEAYLEFNMALINLLSNQKEILAKVESLKVISEEEFKNLTKDYYALEKLFVNFQNAQVARDASMEGSTDDFRATITNFNEDIIELQKDVRSLKTMHWDMKNLWNKAAWTIGGIIAFLGAVELLTGKNLIDFFK